MLDNYERRTLKTLAAASVLNIIATASIVTHAKVPEAGVKERHESHRARREEFDRLQLKTKKLAQEYLDSRRKLLESRRQAIRILEATLMTLKATRDKIRSDQVRDSYNKVISDYEDRLASLKELADQLAKHNEELGLYIKNEMK